MRIGTAFLLIIILIGLYAYSCYMLATKCASSVKTAMFENEKRKATEYYGGVKPNCTLQEALDALDDFIVRIYKNRFKVGTLMPGNNIEIADIELEVRNFAIDVMTKMGYPFKRDLEYYIHEDELHKYVWDQCFCLVAELVKQGVAPMKGLSKEPPKKSFRNFKI